MDLALNNQQRLKCHKAKQRNNLKFISETRGMSIIFVGNRFADLSSNPK